MPILSGEHLISLHELHQGISYSRDSTEQAAVRLGVGRQALAEAQAELKAISQGSDNPELKQSIASLAEVVQVLGATATLLAQYPQPLNNYLSSLGLPAIAEIGIPQLADMPREDANLYTINHSTYRHDKDDKTKKLIDQDSVALAPKAPTIAESSKDTSRTNILEDRDTRTGEVRDVTEHQALQELDTLLQRYINEGDNEELKREAESIRESLNFIGARELDTACKAIANDWKTYLTENPNAQILVAPGMSELERRTKSDMLILEKVLEHINIDALPGRIVAHIDQLSADPKNTRVIVLDDWTMTGKQLSVICKRFAADHQEDPHIANMEINLVIATPEMVRDGFMPLADTEEWEDVDYTFTEPLPLKTHLIAKTRHKDDYPGKFPTTAHITGVHSSGDFVLTHPVEDMVEDLFFLSGEKEDIDVPLLAHGNPQSYSARSYPLTERLRNNR